MADSEPTGGIGFFEKWLSVWVALCIAAGLILGNVAPGAFEVIAGWEYASVNFVVALLIWAMVYPMMVNVDFASIRHIGDRPKGLIITLAVNWLIKPFTMAALGVLFFEVLFADLISPKDAQEYIGGLILLGAAPCTAMVFVWSQMTRGDATYTLVQVSVNDVIMIFAFAPIVALLLGVTDIAVPWETLLLSVGLYVVIPLIAGYVTRQQLMRHADRLEGGEEAVARFVGGIKPFSVIGLLATVVLLFGFQGNVIIEQPLLIALIAAPADHPVLRYLRNRLWRCLGMAGAVQCRGTLRPDRHVQFLRTCRRRRDQCLRPELRRRPCDNRRRPGRSTRYAVTRRLCESNPAPLSGEIARRERLSLNVFFEMAHIGHIARQSETFPVRRYLVVNFLAEHGPLGKVLQVLVILARIDQRLGPIGAVFGRIL